MSEPKFSIVMATLNSLRTLEPALHAIRSQNYPQNQVEILIVDGGSTDGTRETAARFGCRVLDNPAVEPVSAKLIGLREATGDYLIHIDSDEVLQSPESLRKKARTFLENPTVKMVFSTGYVNPPGVPFAARYINEFGDPFSMFYYRLSKHARFLLQTLRRRLPIARETEDALIFTIKPGRPIIFENAACANAIDLRFFRENFAALTARPDGPVPTLSPCQ